MTALACGTADGTAYRTTGLSVRRGEVNQNVDGGWVGGARKRSSLRKVTDRCDTSLVSERRAAHPWVSIRWCTVRRARQAIDTRS